MLSFFEKKKLDAKTETIMENFPSEASIERHVPYHMSLEISLERVFYILSV